MYKALTAISGDQDKLDSLISVINNEGGVIISTTANEHRVFVFYEIPEVGGVNAQ